jgi:hypothetical protein
VIGAPPRRVLAPVMVLGLAFALVGLWYGLIRLGWRWPTPRPELVLAHGPLMVVGFVSTLVGLERAAAIRRWWAYAAPAATVIAGALLLSGRTAAVVGVVAAVGALILVAAYAVILRRQPSLFGGVMALGAALAAAGSILWSLGSGLALVTLWWSAFLVLTIAGERFELGRTARPPVAARRAFVLAVAVLVAGLALTGVEALATGHRPSVPPAWTDAGVRLFGVGLLALAAWLVRYDVARITVRHNGLSRFIAGALLPAYGWLAVAGLLALVAGAAWPGRSYDAAVHALMVGFTISVIYGHAPIVLPILLGRAPVFRRAFYGHLALLHASLLLRVAGDLAGVAAWWRWGGLLGAVSIVWFVAATATAVAIAFRAEGTAPSEGPAEGGDRDAA